jgi:hypothetical protein
MTHHRKRHKARRRRRQRMHDGMKVTITLKDAVRTFKVVSLQVHRGSGLLLMVCVGGWIEEFRLSDVLELNLVPRSTPPPDTGPFSNLEAYDAG